MVTVTNGAGVFRAGTSMVSNTGGAVAPNENDPVGKPVIDGLEKSKIGQAIADVGVAGSAVAIDVAKNGDNTKFIKGIKITGGAGGFVSLWGAGNDAIKIFQDYRDGNRNFGSIKIGDAISFFGNALGVVAGVGVVMFAGATAPAWVTGAAVGSLALGVASLYVGYKNGDLTFSQLGEQIGEFVGEMSKNFNEYIDKKALEWSKNALEKHEQLDKFIEKITETLTKADTYNPTKLLEKLLEPVAEFTKEITETVDNSIDKAIDKVKEIIKEIQKAIKEQADNFIEKIDDLSDHIAGELARWLGLNRDGKHYFVDPLVLDLDGDGIETVGHNKKQGAMFDLECVNDGVYGLVG